MTAATGDYLTNLYIAKLNWALKSRKFLKHWGRCLAVLLEKKFCSVFFNELGAIILFETGFNWLQNIVFSDRATTINMKCRLISEE